MPTPSRWSLRVLLALAVCHFVVAVLYAAVTPYLTPGFTQGQEMSDIGAPDEKAHILVIKELVDGHGYPVLRRGFEAYEAHQPPMYYCAMAAWSNLIGKDPLDRSAGVPLRFPNAVFGALAVVGAFFFAFWATGDERLALLASAVMAFLPQMGALSGAISNDPLIIALCTWSLGLMMRHRNAWTVRCALITGLMVGLATLTKATGLLLVPVLLVSVLASNPRPKLSAWLVGFLAVAIVTAPWLIRNQLIYHHPLGLNAFYETFDRGVWPEKVFSGVHPLLKWGYDLVTGTLLSFVGLFGYMDIHLPYWIYVPTWFILLACFFRSATRKNESSIRWPVGLFFLLLLGSFISYNLWQVQPQARYLFPALAVIALWISVGLQRFSRDAFPKAAVGLALLLLAIDLYSLATLPGEFGERVQEYQRLHPGPQSSSYRVLRRRGS